MRSIALRLTTLGLFVALSGPALAHGGHDHAKKVCKKDGKVIKVKGKTDDDKKANCEAKGGSWEDAADD